MEGLAQAASQSDEKVEALEGELQAVTAPVADLQYDQHLLRALDLLTRAELHLAQGNAGLARSEVAVARALLSDLQTQLPARYQDAMAAILTRLDLVLGNLPGATDLARGDLDVAWQLLLRGLTGDWRRGGAHPDTHSDAHHHAHAHDDGDRHANGDDDSVEGNMETEAARVGRCASARISRAC